MEKHARIRIDKIPIKGWPGLLIVLAILLMFLIEVPATRWFLLLTFPVGVLIALVLYIWDTRRK